jgi:putative ATP-dependent endonuclease of OLD family
MKIKSFAVNNFRGINGGLDKNTINFDDSNTIFVFGQNNVGKSSILKAYEAFYEDKADDKDLCNSNSNDIEIEIEFYIDGSSDKAVIDAQGGNKYQNLEAKYLDSDKVLKLKKTFDRTTKKPKNQTFNRIDNIYEDVGYGGIGAHGPFKSMMLQPLYIKAMPNEQDVENIVTEVLKEVATSRLSGAQSKQLKDAEEVIERLQSEIYKSSDIDTYRSEVNSKFNHLFDGFEIDIDSGSSRAKFTHDKIGKDFKVKFKTTADTPLLNDYDQMGHGSVRIAIFLLMLMRDKLRGESDVKKNFLVLFEEPELFLHPVLTKELRSLIYEVSDSETPFQVLCASHSPQMIDISKEHSSLVRMIKDDNGTHLFQVRQNDLKNAQQNTNEKVKQKLYEILRFDPYVCESFYANEVLLVEGDTEAIIARGFQQEFQETKNVFVVNCHSVTNIPFYQKFFSKFKITYSVICDTDSTKEPEKGWNGEVESPVFTGGIQKSIYDQYTEDNINGIAKSLLVFDNTFETPHIALADPFKYSSTGAKSVRANAYWTQILEAKTDENNDVFNLIPIISYLQKIMLKGE